VLRIPLPGETALITAALYAGMTHHLNIVVLAAVAAAAAVIGDNVGYWIGRTGGCAWLKATGVLSAWTARSSRSDGICSPRTA